MSNKFEWGSIKSEIIRGCENAFREQGLNIPLHDIEKSLVVLRNLIELNVSYFEIRDFGNRVKIGLQQCYIEKLGDVNALVQLASSIESILKVILIQAGLKRYSDINRNEISLKPLAEYTSAFGSTPIGSLKNIDKQTLNRDSNGKFLLACAYEARNIDLHNTPAWDRATVMNYVKHILAFLIYCIHHLYSILSSSHPELTVENSSNEISPADLQAYDLVTFGKSAGEYKSRMLQASIIHYLSEGSHSKDEIEQSIEKKFQHRMPSGVMKALKRLLEVNKIVGMPAPSYGLTESEKDRISKLREDFSNNLQQLKNDIIELLHDTLLNGQEDQVLECLSDFWDEFVLSYGNDKVSERFDFKNTELGKYIFERNNSWDETNELIIRLIELCKGNDCLKRKSFGRSCTRIMGNPDFKLEMGSRNIWVDTQIALYMLAMPGLDFAAPSHPLFKSIKEMNSLIMRNKDLLPKIGKVYLSEIKNHLKEALSLCNFESCPWFYNKMPSKNVFFNYYTLAKNDHVLPQGIDTFEDYLDLILNVYPSDLDESNWESILYKAIEDQFESIGVEIVMLPEAAKTKEAITVFEAVIRNQNFRPKSEIAMKNDAWMGAYLFENSDICSPIFVSLDKSFPYFRAKFIDQYYRNKFNTWQIFTPSKLVNQLELLNMEFRPDSISDGILLILESDKIDNNMSDFLDNVIRLTSNKWTTSTVEKRRQEKILAKFFHKEFENIGNDDEINTEYSSKFISIWDSVINYFENKDGARKNEFFRIISVEDVFDEVVHQIDMHIDRGGEKIDELFNQLTEYFAYQDQTSNLNDCRVKE